jgi:hypothetical protein
VDYDVIERGTRGLSGELRCKGERLETSYLEDCDVKERLEVYLEDSDVKERE